MPSDDDKVVAHKKWCGVEIFGKDACTCVDRWSPRAKLEECGNHTGEMYLDSRGGFVKFADHQLAIREAIHETRKRQWIPVSEELPEKGNIVIVANSDLSRELKECVAEIAEFDGQDEPLGFDSTFFVTHWMPLPEPPVDSKDAAEGTEAR